MKKFLLLFITFIQFSTVIQAGTLHNGIYYNVESISNKRVVVSKCEKGKYSGHILIPDKITLGDNVYTVIGIEGGAFKDSDIESISIPQTVSYIGASAFWACKKLKTVNIKGGVKEIEGNAFISCDNLESIQFGYDLEIIEHNAFAYCKNLNEIHLPGTLKRIGSQAFQGCESLKEIYIPNSVEKIYAEAFEDCYALESVEFGPECKIEELCYEMFHYCKNLKNVKLPDHEYLKEIGTMVFSECESLTQIVIPYGVKIIGSAFGGCSNLEKVYIPETVDSIAGAFCRCESLHNIDLPPYLTSIANNLFSGCTSLEEIEIPPFVKFIGNSAFENCSNLTKVTWRTTSLSSCLVNSIGSSAFAVCSKLSSIELPDNIAHIGSCAFYNCSSLKLLYLPEKLAYIPNHLIDFCSLERLTIPKSVSKIELAAFYQCSIKELKSYIISPFIIEDNVFGNNLYDNTKLIVPKGTKKKYEETSAWNKFSQIVEEDFEPDDDAIVLTANSYSRQYGDPNPVFDYTSSGAKAGEPVIKCAATANSSVGTYPIVIEKGSVSNSDVTLVNGTLTITEAPLIISVGNYTKMEGEDNPNFKLSYSGFKNNETESVLSKKPTITCNATKDSKVGNYEIVISGASATNYSITYQSGTLTIKAKGSDTPDDINGEVFSAKTAEGLEMIFKVISGSDKTCQVGDGKSAAIDGITGAISIPESVIYNGISYSVKSIGLSAFFGCSNLTSVSIPNSVTSIEGSAFQGSGLTSVTIPSSVKTIGSLAFDACTRLTSIIIPNSVTAISEYTFYGCSALTSVTIPNSVTSIGNRAFSGCSSLTSITIPNRVTSIGTSAFYGCTSLTSATIPSSVISLGNSVFNGCCNLASLTIGSGVTNIGYYALRECSSLANVYCYAEKVPTTDKSAFDDSNVGNATLYVPNGTKQFYEQSNVWIKFKKIIELNAINGDVTGDGEVTKEDITKVETEILEPSEDFDPNKDVNRDGVVNVADVVELVSIINSGEGIGSGYFWMGNYLPNSYNFPTLNGKEVEGIVTTYTSLADAMAKASRVYTAGEWAVVIYPLSWGVEDGLVFLDSANKKYYATKRKNLSDFPGYLYYESTEKIGTNTTITLSTKTYAEAAGATLSSPRIL